MTFSAAAHLESVRLMLDERADGGTRLITFTQEFIRIDRRLSGMKMRIHVPVEAYAGVLLRMRELGGKPIYEIELAHRDADLSVLLDTVPDRDMAQDLCREWAIFFKKPTLDRGLTQNVPAGSEAAPVKARRRCMTHVAKRRPRRVLRRKPGNRENLGILRHGEREIICYE